MNHIRRTIAELARNFQVFEEDSARARRANRVLFAVVGVLFAFCVVMTVVQWFI